MTPDLSSALDDCLARVRAGEPLESVVADRPDDAAELASLVRTALAFQPLRENVTPDPAVVAARRAEFLAAAARLRRAEAAEVTRPTFGQRLTRWLDGLVAGRPVAVRWATTLAMAVVLFVIAGGAVIAANDALPGEPLYTVKRVAENVQLTLTFDEVSQEKLRMQQAGRRQAEVMALVSAGREAGVTFEGIVVEKTVRRLTIAGFPPVLLDSQTVVVGTLEPGARVQVSGEVKVDATVRATRVQVIAAPPTATPTVAVAASVTRTAQPSATWTGTPVASDTAGLFLPVESFPTRPPTRTPRLRPVATLMPTHGPTAPPAWTATVLPTPFPTPTRVQRYRFEGRIEAITGQEWTIDGRDVLVTGSTSVDQSQGKAEVGALVSVTAERRPDDSLVALKITVKQPQPLEFSGPVEEIGQAHWIVGGRKVQISAATQITGKAEKGATAHVKGIRLADDSILASEILVEPAQIVQFTAPITSMGTDSWVIGNLTVYIDAETKIEGTPAVRAIAEVTARVRVDGSLLAIDIRVRSRPTATPSPTLPPVETPTPEPSATPVPPAEARVTPTAEPTETDTEPTPAQQPSDTLDLGAAGVTTREPDAPAMLVTPTPGAGGER